MPNYPAAQSLQIGGRVFTDLVNLIYLIGFTNDATNKYCSPRLANGTSGYQVPNGKTLRIWAMTVTDDIANSGSASRTHILGSNDVDLGINGTTAPTNPVYLGGSITITYGTSGGGNNPQQQYNQANLNWTIPQNKYLFVQNNSASAIQTTSEFWGYLE